MKLLTYADRAVALVNTDDHGTGQDYLQCGDDVCRLLPDGWRVSHTVAEAGLPELREARPRLRRVFELAATGRVERATDALNKLLCDFPVSASISDHTTGWHLHLSDEPQGPARSYVTGAAFGLAYTIAERGPERLGLCDALPCRAVFVDTTTNSSRRYCSDRCATRANVAAYRARKRGDC
ncbi:CGNR zinc finger domain-containing protein [Catenulispora pinisilvae]|uniref:CGNR zinc finger domain-containing protein n=1 Tax=Catenulispora pinisilvae TaxID=2705253 RepID=UPI001891C146|nr:CGNR zinc finger domain-containing protein [Catenulispora pinisilvae]